MSTSVWDIPSQAVVFANGIKQISGQIRLNSRGEATSYPTFDGPMLADTVGEYELSVESSVFKADGLSAADALAKALSESVQFTVTVLSIGKTFAFMGKRRDSDITMNPKEAGKHERTYVITKPIPI